MGLGSYLKGGKPKRPPPADLAPANASPSEKPISSMNATDPLPRPMPVLGQETHLGSSRSSVAPSLLSNRSDFFDDIKYEVMVNYLFQQQCSYLWVSQGNNAMEGVLLRKTRNQYLACPPQLAGSELAASCAELNVQVLLP